MSSLNLNKHGAAMQEAWKEVRNVKSDTNWALFGYEGKSFDLKLVATGEDGVDELKDDLSDAKIMYGFIRVEDPKTSLPKYVFLHWQGESVPGTRKGLSATHLKDIEKYFYGAHLTIHARNDDEVDEKDIVDKVSKVSATAYNFKEQRSSISDAPKPGIVGSVHQKINPKAELPDMDAREKFWNSEESREKDRIAKEKERKKSEAKQLDTERRSREEREASARDAAIKEREKKISQIKASEAKANQVLSEDSAKKWEAQMAADVEDSEARKNRADELKKQRSEEAKQLIGQRSTEARAVFERNSSVGQMNFRKPSINISNNGSNQINHHEEVAKIEESTTPPKEENANEVSTEDIVVPPPESFGNDDNAEAQQNNIPIPAPPDVTGATASHQPDLIQDVASKQAPDLTSSARATEEEVSPPSSNVNNGTSEFGLCAMALYDYQAADETEISFDPGQLITHIDQIDPGWWQGLGPDGNYGLFPANYVEVVDPSTMRNQ